MTSRDHWWLTYNCYHEAQGEPFEGKVAVVHVVLNRCEIRNKSIEQVIRERKQFSWHNGNKFPSVKYPLAMLECAKAVDQCLSERANGFTFSDCDHYYSVTIPEPYWAGSMMFYRQVGKHRFYCRG